MHDKLFIKIFIKQYYINKNSTQCPRRLSRGPIPCLIVYYAPRKEKTWTVHSSCKSCNTSCGPANFSPMVHILFFVIAGPKIPHSRSCTGRECGTFGQDITKNKLLIVCEFTILRNQTRSPTKKLLNKKKVRKCLDIHDYFSV